MADSLSVRSHYEKKIRLTSSFAAYTVVPSPIFSMKITRIIFSNNCIVLYFMDMGVVIEEKGIIKRPPPPE